MERPKKIDAEKALTIVQDLGDYTFTHKDFIHYALSIGFSMGTFLNIKTPTRRKTLSTPTNTTTHSQVNKHLSSLPHLCRMLRPRKING